MSAAEKKSEAIRLMKLRVFSEQGGLCWACHEPIDPTSFELAHRIPQRKWAIALWGSAVIHHRMNMVGTHPGLCNQHAQVNPNGVGAAVLADSIRSQISGEGRNEGTTSKVRLSARALPGGKRVRQARREDLL